ncbi:hypothetical protein HaLaN_10824 [Haematococcus lacustris]|uniref:Uncharacterized protein n=1 Tax=Haematococcus lacustris TaxID=44745 RepID=A0A699Z777_HAELA|nr:hypothetical protein HaLaN_10824 [Haematococcus lacustris]
MLFLHSQTARVVRHGHQNETSPTPQQNIDAENLHRSMAAMQQQGTLVNLGLPANGTRVLAASRASTMSVMPHLSSAGQPCPDQLVE